MVINVSKDFLVRGQNELAQALVNKINRLGESGFSISLNMGDYLADYVVPGVTLTISDFKILDPSAALGKTAPKSIDMSEYCECIEGSFGMVD